MTLEDVIIPRLRTVELSDPAALRQAFSWFDGNLGARALVDNACWSLRAAAAKKPLWKQWGGKQEVDLLWIVTRQKPALRRSTPKCVQDSDHASEPVPFNELMPATRPRA